MFGFLRLKSCGLSEAEKLAYRSHFCSACHCMTEFGGRISSLLTNYDITFWLLLQTALDSNPVSPVEARPCTALPFRKVAVRPLPPRVGKTMAALNLLLIGSKAQDDENDGERWKARAARALYGRKFELARFYLESEGVPVEQIMGLAAEQSAAENHPSPTLESLAAPTAATLGEVFAVIALLQRKPELADLLRELGEHLGSYLYLWDALTDLERDRKRGDFNALLRTGRRDPTPLLRKHLKTLRELLDRCALGPEGALCYQLLDSLAVRLREVEPVRRCSPDFAPRKRLARAGFVKAMDDECCECDCCECGSCCECNLCDCNPCGHDHSHCCEFNCCSGDDWCCCCCRGDSRTPRGSSGGCCSDDLFCCSDLLCDDGGTATSRREGFFERVSAARKSRFIPALEGSASARACPRCELLMIKLSVGQTEIDECRNCGGTWLDDKELEELAKFPLLPHNLLNRYPVGEQPAAHLPGERNCVKCEEKLVVVPYLGVAVEMCRKCHGFWLDHGTLHAVLKAKRSPQRMMKAHKSEWRCPYCENIARGGADVCQDCGAPRPKSGFTGKLV